MVAAVSKQNGGQIGLDEERGSVAVDGLQAQTNLNVFGLKYLSLNKDERNKCPEVIGPSAVVCTLSVDVCKFKLWDQSEHKAQQGQRWPEIFMHAPTFTFTAVSDHWNASRPDYLQVAFLVPCRVFVLLASTTGAPAWLRAGFAQLPSDKWALQMDWRLPCHAWVLATLTHQMAICRSARMCLWEREQICVPDRAYALGGTRGQEPLLDHTYVFFWQPLTPNCAPERPISSPAAAVQLGAPLQAPRSQTMQQEKQQQQQQQSPPSVGAVAVCGGSNFRGPLAVAATAAMDDWQRRMVLERIVQATLRGDLPSLKASCETYRLRRRPPEGGDTGKATWDAGGAGGAGVPDDRANSGVGAAGSVEAAAGAAGAAAVTTESREQRGAAPEAAGDGAGGSWPKDVRDCVSEAVVPTEASQASGAAASPATPGSAALPDSNGAVAPLREEQVLSPAGVRSSRGGSPQSAVLGTPGSNSESNTGSSVGAHEWARIGSRGGSKDVLPSKQDSIAEESAVAVCLAAEAADDGGSAGNGEGSPVAGSGGGSSGGGGSRGSGGGSNSGGGSSAGAAAIAAETAASAAALPAMTTVAPSPSEPPRPPAAAPATALWPPPSFLLGSGRLLTGVAAQLRVPPAVVVYLVSQGSEMDIVALRYILLNPLALPAGGYQDVQHFVLSYVMLQRNPITSSLVIAWHLSNLGKGFSNRAREYRAIADRLRNLAILLVEQLNELAANLVEPDPELDDRGQVEAAARVSERTVGGGTATAATGSGKSDAVDGRGGNGGGDAPGTAAPATVAATASTATAASTAAPSDSTGCGGPGVCDGVCDGGCGGTFSPAVTLTDVLAPAGLPSSLNDLSPVQVAFTSTNMEFICASVAQTYLMYRWHGREYTTNAFQRPLPAKNTDHRTERPGGSGSGAATSAAVAGTTGSAPAAAATRSPSPAAASPGSGDHIRYDDDMLTMRVLEAAGFSGAMARVPVRFLSKMVHALTVAPRPLFDSPRGRWLFRILCEIVILVVFHAVQVRPAESAGFPNSQYVFIALLASSLLDRGQELIYLYSNRMGDYFADGVHVLDAICLGVVFLSMVLKAVTENHLGINTVEWRTLHKAQTLLFNTTPILMWTRMLQFLLPLAPSIAVLLQVVAKLLPEIIKFLVPGCIMTVGVALTLYITFRDRGIDSLGTFSQILLQLFKTFLGETMFDTISDEKDSVLNLYGNIIVLLYTFLSAVLVSNLLIAFVNFNYQPVKSAVAARFQLFSILVRFEFMVNHHLLGSPFTLPLMVAQRLLPSGWRSMTGPGPQWAVRAGVLPLDGNPAPGESRVVKLYRTGSAELPYLVFLLTFYPLMMAACLVLAILLGLYCVPYFAVRGHRNWWNTLAAECDDDDDDDSSDGGDASLSGDDNAGERDGRTNRSGPADGLMRMPPWAERQSSRAAWHPTTSVVGTAGRIGSAAGGVQHMSVRPGIRVAPLQPTASPPKSTAAAAAGSSLYDNDGVIHADAVAGIGVPAGWLAHRLKMVEHPTGVEDWQYGQYGIPYSSGWHGTWGDGGANDDLLPGLPHFRFWRERRIPCSYITRRLRALRKWTLKLLDIALLRPLLLLLGFVLYYVVLVVLVLGLWLGLYQWLVRVAASGYFVLQGWTLGCNQPHLPRHIAHRHTASAGNGATLPPQQRHVNKISVRSSGFGSSSSGTATADAKSTDGGPGSRPGTRPSSHTKSSFLGKMVGSSSSIWSNGSSANGAGPRDMANSRPNKFLRRQPVWIRAVQARLRNGGQVLSSKTISDAMVRAGFGPRHVSAAAVGAEAPPMGPDDDLMASPPPPPLPPAVQEAAVRGHMDLSGARYSSVGASLESAVAVLLKARGKAGGSDSSAGGGGSDGQQAAGEHDKTLLGALRNLVVDALHEGRGGTGGGSAGGGAGGASGATGGSAKTPGAAAAAPGAGNHVSVAADSRSNPTLHGQPRARTPHARAAAALSAAMEAVEDFRERSQSGGVVGANVLEAAMEAVSEFREEELGFPEGGGKPAAAAVAGTVAGKTGQTADLQSGKACSHTRAAAISTGMEAVEGFREQRQEGHGVGRGGISADRSGWGTRGAPRAQRGAAAGQ